MATRRTTPGITVRHSRECRTAAGGSCNCTPVYEAWVFDKKGGPTNPKTGRPKGRKIYRRFPTMAAAKNWRADATSQVNNGTMRATTATTLREAADLFAAGMKTGDVRTRGGRAYKPSVIRTYERDYTKHVLDDLGGRKVSDITRHDLQALADRLVGSGLSASRVHGIFTAVQALFRRELRLGRITVSPCAHLDLPAVEGRRERVATAAEALELLDALPDAQRAVWATAFFGGLRRGELRALRWSDIDLARGVIDVRRSWDDKEGAIEPKSRKGTRRVPIPAVLRDYLTEHKTEADPAPEHFVFAGSSPTSPFTPTHVRSKALKAWAAANVKRAEEERPLLVPIGLHEARHTYVSMMHDAGLSLERIGDYVGHSSTYMTDHYRHLLGDHLEDAAKRLDAYVQRADTASRVRAIGGAG